MKFLRFFSLLLFVSIMLSSCYIGRFFYWNFADINDYKKFKYTKVSKPAVPFTFKIGKTAKPFDTIRYNDVLYKFDDFIELNKSVAFLVIRNDSILYEKYFEGRDQASYVPSFSAAKSYVSALVGFAIADGAIKSVNQPITDYLPELLKNDARFSKITIRHLLNMRSGILFKEMYFNPFGNVARSYYGRNLYSQLKKLKIKEAPDKEFEYISENTQLLAFIVERATGKKLPDYLQEKIWQPLGMEYDATWSIDSKRHKEAKAFCCLNAVARDFAKFGRLYLHNGNWNGKQILPASWVKESTVINDSTRDNFYTYQWWHYADWSLMPDTAAANAAGSKDNAGNIDTVTYKNSKGKMVTYLVKPDKAKDFFADGLYGQFIYVYPEKNIIIVRLGKQAKVNWPEIFSTIVEQL